MHASRLLPVWACLALLGSSVFLAPAAAQQAGPADADHALPSAPRANPGLPAFGDASDPLSAIPDPIGIGMERFSERIESIRRMGREPVGLVLSGGSARAFAHIGVLEVLEEEGIRPDFIVANSMGAVVGILYAAGIAPADIALLVSRIPVENQLTPVLPLKGGFLNADRFAAMTRVILGPADLSELPIPVMVLIEDLRTRRQVRFASGDAATVMIASFALPGFFEPVKTRGFELIDGGITNLVPVGAAAAFTKAVIASTAMYDRDMTFGNPVTVINRAIDISKSRSAMEDIFRYKPAVIRNDVEKVSFMEFTDSAAIVERGRKSARDAIPAVRAALLAAGARLPDGLPAPGDVPAGAPSEAQPGTPSGAPAALEAARARFSVSLPRVIDRIERGVRPPVTPGLAWKVALRFADEMEGSGLWRDGARFAGLNAAFSAGGSAFSLGAAGAWGADRYVPATSGPFLAFVGMDLNPVDSLVLEAETRLVADFGAPPGAVVESFEIAARAAWRSPGAAFHIEPEAKVLVHAGAGFTAWGWNAALSLSLRSGSAGTGPLGASGPAFFSQVDPGAFAESPAAFALSAGPSWLVKLGFGKPGLGALRIRASGTWDLSGPGIAARAADVFRGPALAGTAAFRVTGSAEAAWDAVPLEFDLAESVIFKKIEIGPYVDLAWTGGVTSPAAVPFTGAAGLALALSISPMGLVPVEFSIYAGVGFDGTPVLGLRTGRLFPSIR